MPHGVSRFALFIAAVLLALPAALPASTQADHYILPFPKQPPRLLLQGYAGPYGHQGMAEFAYDFQMPIGSSILAARAGEVVHLEESKPDSTRKPGDENVIVIKHADGSFARYYHLTTKGVLVEHGDKVAQGQPIALSGDSGASAGPHLHFDVSRGCFAWGTCQTIPITFVNVPENPLKQGTSYGGGGK